MTNFLIGIVLDVVKLVDTYTIHVPSEGISQFLSIDFHVQPDGNQRLHLRCVLMDHCGVVVIKAEQTTTTSVPPKDGSTRLSIIQHSHVSDSSNYFQDNLAFVHQLHRSLYL